MSTTHLLFTNHAISSKPNELQRTDRTATKNPLHIMDVTTLDAPSLRDELRLHSRYIRDTLVPILSRPSKLTHPDHVLLRSIFKKLESIHMNLELLRYSRMEKALMVIAATGASTVMPLSESKYSYLESLD